jgi:hypothetical protein
MADTSRLALVVVSAGSSQAVCHGHRAGTRIQGSAARRTDEDLLTCQGLSRRALSAETGWATERLRVREIDDDEGRRLVRIIRRGSGLVVTWRRAQLVLLSAQDLEVPAIWAPAVSIAAYRPAGCLWPLHFDPRRASSVCTSIWRLAARSGRAKPQCAGQGSLRRFSAGKRISLVCGLQNLAKRTARKACQAGRPPERGAGPVNPGEIGPGFRVRSCALLPWRRLAGNHSVARPGASKRAIRSRSGYCQERERHPAAHFAVMGRCGRRTGEPRRAAQAGRPRTSAPPPS